MAMQLCPNPGLEAAPLLGAGPGWGQGRGEATHTAPVATPLLAKHPWLYHCWSTQEGLAQPQMLLSCRTLQTANKLPLLHLQHFCMQEGPHMSPWQHPYQRPPSWAETTPRQHGKVMVPNSDGTKMCQQDLANKEELSPSAGGCEIAPAVRGKPEGERAPRRRFSLTPPLNDNEQRALLCQEPLLFG